MLVQRDREGHGGAPETCGTGCRRRGGGDGHGLERLRRLFGPCFDVEGGRGRGLAFLRAGVAGWVDGHGHVGHRYDWKARSDKELMLVEVAGEKSGRGLSDGVAWDVGWESMVLSPISGH